MISKAFQSIVSQMSEIFPKKFGIADSTGLVLATNGIAISGDVLEEIFDSATENDLDKTFVRNGYTVRLIDGKPYPEYAVFVDGTDEVAKYCCNSVCVASNNVRRYYDEKYDKTIFMQNIIFDNILAFDLHQKALELHVDVEVPRAVYYIKVIKKGELGIYEVVRNMFPDKEKDFVINIDSNNIVLIKELKRDKSAKAVDSIARQILDNVHSETLIGISVGVSSVCENINQLNNAYKEAQIALEVGKVFDEEKSVLNYDNLGIGRLIYQLPIKLCELFLHEVFKKGDLSMLDSETILTINNVNA
ncbi:MAG: PucR family transcriptional regulator, partial [Clostridia bacterium]|nr:PucR family transcriptional regulator [Clostridia bacterium]